MGCGASRSTAVAAAPPGAEASTPQPKAPGTSNGITGNSEPNTASQTSSPDNFNASMFPDVSKLPKVATTATRRSTESRESASKSKARECGVSFSSLLDLSQTVDGEATVQQIIESKVIPSTTKSKDCFASTLPKERVSRPDYYISHSRTLSFQSLVEQLRRHFGSGLDPDTTFVWLEFLAVPQFPGGSSRPELVEISDIIKSCKTTIVLVDAKGQIFTRLEPLVDVWQAAGQSQKKLKVLVETGGVPEQINRSISTLEVVRAQPQAGADKDQILDHIQEKCGYEEFNRVVRQALTSAMQDRPTSSAKRRGAVLKSTPSLANRSVTEAKIAFEEGRYDEFRVLADKALPLLELESGPQSAEVAEMISMVARSLGAQSRYAEAAVHLAKVLAISEVTKGKNSREWALAASRMGVVLAKAGKCPEGLAQSRTALTVMEAVVGASHPDTALTIINLTQVMELKGEVDEEAEGLQRRALAILTAHQREVAECSEEERVPSDNLEGVLVRCLLGLSKILLLRGNMAEAITMAKEAHQRLADDPSSQTGGYHGGEGMAVESQELLVAGLLAAGEKLEGLQELGKLMDGCGGASNLAALRACHRVGAQLCQMGQPEQAVRVYKQVVPEALQVDPPRRHHQRRTSHSHGAHSASRSNHPRTQLSPESSEMVSALTQFASAATTLHQYSSAETSLRHALNIMSGGSSGEPFSLASLAAGSEGPTPRRTTNSGRDWAVESMDDEDMNAVEGPDDEEAEDGEDDDENGDGGDGNDGNKSVRSERLSLPGRVKKGFAQSDAGSDAGGEGRSGTPRENSAAVSHPQGGRRNPSGGRMKMELEEVIEEPESEEEEEEERAAARPKSGDTRPSSHRTGTPGTPSSPERPQSREVQGPDPSDVPGCEERVDIGGLQLRLAATVRLQGRLHEASGLYKKVLEMLDPKDSRVELARNWLKKLEGWK